MSEVPRLTVVSGLDGRSGRLPGVRVEGDWGAGELHRMQRSDATVLMYGDCPPHDTNLERAIDAAVQDNDMRALAQLPGSSATIIARPGNGAITAVADLAGQHPLYYRKDHEALVLSTETKPIRERMSQTTLDALSAAASLALPNPTDLLAGRSVIDGVSRLEAGHAVTFDGDGQGATTPYEALETPVEASFEEAAMRLREALIQAASLRVASGLPLSADMSGGLDSTSFDYLLAQSMTDPLLTTTRYVLGVPSEDLERVRSLMSLPASSGLFDHHEYHDPRNALPFHNLPGAPIDDEPNVGTADHARLLAYTDFLRAQGSELHMDGFGGDCLFDMEPLGYLSGLARSHKYFDLARYAREVGRTTRQAPSDIIREAAQRSMATPATDMALLARILRGEKTPDVLKHGARVFGSSAAPQWLTPHARRELADLADARAVAMEALDGCDYGNYLAYRGVQDEAAVHHRLSRLARTRGLRRSAPYFDNPVLQASLSIPTHIRVNPWRFKALLAKATEGLVPPEVTSRSTRGDYGEQFRQGLRAALGDFHALLGDSRLAQLGIIEPRAVAASLERVPMNGQTASASLLRFASLEQWLRAQDEPPATGSLPADVRTAWSMHPKEHQKEPPLPPGTSRYTSPDAVHITTCPTGATALHVAKDKYYRLDADTTRILTALNQGGNFEGAIALLQQANPDRGLEWLRQAASSKIGWLEERGLITEGEGGVRMTQGTATKKYTEPAYTRQNDEVLRVHPRHIPAALGGIALATHMAKWPLAKRLGTVRFLLERWAKEPMEPKAGQELLHTVTRLSEFRLGRAACMELSTATVLAAAFERRGLDLVIGVATDPDYYHTWPEANGVPIRTANDPEISGVFDPLVKIRCS